MKTSNIVSEIFLFAFVLFFLATLTLGYLLFPAGYWIATGTIAFACAVFAVQLREPEERTLSLEELFDILEDAIIAGDTDSEEYKRAEKEYKRRRQAS